MLGSLADRKVGWGDSKRKEKKKTTGNRVVVKTSLGGGKSGDR